MFWNRNKKEKIKAVEITDQNFNELIPTAGMPVLLDFWAPWCGPCQVMLPIIDELAGEYQGKALIGKINTQQNPALAAHFKIKSIPTLVMIEKQNLAERWSGIVPKPNLEEILNAYIEDWVNEEDQIIEEDSTSEEE